MRNLFLLKKLNICRNPYFPPRWFGLLDTIGQGGGEWGASGSRRAGRVLQQAVEQKMIGAREASLTGKQPEGSPEDLTPHVLPLISLPGRE